MPEALRRVLGDDIVRTVDAFWAAAERLALLVAAAGSEPQIRAAVREAREALGLWLALLVERLDGRNATTLVALHQRVDALEAQIKAQEDAPDA